MRKYADNPALDPEVFVQRYRNFLVSNINMDAAPLTGPRLRKRFHKMGIHTARTAGVLLTSSNYTRL